MKMTSTLFVHADDVAEFFVCSISASSFFNSLILKIEQKDKFKCPIATKASKPSENSVVCTSLVCLRFSGFSNLFSNRTCSLDFYTY